DATPVVCDAGSEESASSGRHPLERECDDMAGGRSTIMLLMAPQPTGTVKPLFSDIEGSTALLERLGASRYAEALGLHRRLMRAAFEAHEGYEVDTEGD